MLQYFGQYRINYSNYSLLNANTDYLFIIYFIARFNDYLLLQLAINYKFFEITLDKSKFIISILLNYSRSLE